MQQKNSKAWQNDILKSLKRFLAVFFHGVVALLSAQVVGFVYPPKMQGPTRQFTKKAASHRVATVCWEHRVGPDFSLNLIQLGDIHE